jgi:S1-C subfamily serine protease
MDAFTNRHVIENATEITVTLLDNRHFQATVVGSDEGTDIAVLKAAEPRLTQMPLGDRALLTWLPGKTVRSLPVWVRSRKDDFIGSYFSNT